MSIADQIPEYNGTISRSRALSLLKAGTAFVFGQGLVQAMTLVVGLVIVRLLPVEQYALYTIGGTLLVVVSLGSNFGLAQGIVSLGSAHRQDRHFLGELLDAARRWSRRLMIVAMAATIALACFMLRDPRWSLVSDIACVAVVLLAGWAQVSGSLGRAVLNIHHDARSIFKATMGEAATRFALLSLCLIWPTALAALLANFAGAFVSSRITLSKCRNWCDTSAEGHPEQSRKLRAFVLPIAPIVIYSLLQGQIAILLLSAAGATRVIAETGALSRLGQVFLVLTLLNTFMVQPVFARIRSRADFLVRLTMLLVALTALSSIVMISAFVAPNWWLLIVGSKYAHLSGELPIALATSLATLSGASFYVVVIARGRTGWQSLAILPCLGSQVMFVALNGVRTTADALMLNFLPAFSYALVQAVFIVMLVRRWPDSPAAATAV
jgi:hypothetical protein